MEKQTGLRARVREVGRAARWMFSVAAVAVDLVTDDQEIEVVKLRRALAEARREIDLRREAHEQISVDLLVEGGRRRELEALLEAPENSEPARWAEMLEAWRRVQERGPEIPTSTSDLAELVALCDKLVARATMLYNALNRDRTGLAAALVEVQRTAAGYFWITRGRGSYTWDDDRYCEETGHALSAIIDTARSALNLSGDRATAAIRDKVVLDETSVPLDVVVAGVLIDRARLRGLLEQSWDEVRGEGRFGPTGDENEPLFTLLPRFEHLEPEQIAAFERAVAVALRGAQKLAGPRKVRAPAVASTAGPVEAP